MWFEFTSNTIKLINNNDIIINNLFINKIKDIRNNINDIPDIEYKIIEYKISNKKLLKLANTDWVIDNLDWSDLTYDVNIKWSNNNIFIKTTRKKFIKFKKRLNQFLKIITYIKGSSVINVNLYMVLTPLKKKVELNKVIAPKHINSGYTNTKLREIFIWREEEFEKVSFHELIHLFDKDHRHETIDIPININGPTSFFEAITDFKAIIYNIIYLSLITNKKIKSILNYEIKFIYNQANFIACHLNKTSNNIIIQKSPAYSYFILKKFIFEYFINTNIVFNEILFDDIFLKSINYSKLIKLISIYELNELNEFIDFNSARMTLFELL